MNNQLIKDLAPQPPSLLVQGGVLKEFIDAATQAVQVASCRKVPSYLIHPGCQFYNIYLTRDMKFEGFTPNLKSNHTALRRRKRIFTISSKVYWAITFNRGRSSAVAHHRSGYRVRLLNEPK